MNIKSISYSEYDAEPKKQWKFNEFTLNKINLFVGKNSSGKTRVLNVIRGIGDILMSPKLVFNEGTYKIVFETTDGRCLTYQLEHHDGNIVRELFDSDQRNLIDRSEMGKGKIWNENANKYLDFQIPENEIAATRRDLTQYPFLEDLFEWASKVRHFRFSNEQEKNSLALIDANRVSTDNINLKETDRSMNLFSVASSKFGSTFAEVVVSDFNKIGYSIESIEIGPLESIKVEGPMLQPAIVGFKVKEKDRIGFTEQNTMSDGMFRALSILIHFNYYQLENLSGTVLVDDIGEGLDFERSTLLIELLIEKAQNTGIQLLMSTNDKFVMNHTDLQFWQLVHREGSEVQILNISNSKEKFDDFKYTGLNNFDFFTSDFARKGFDENE